MDQPQNKPKTLPKHTIGLMIAVALLYDGIQALLQIIPLMGQILSTFVGFFAFGTFYLWFKFKGFKFATVKRAGALGGGFILELIPFINALPIWTLSVLLIIMDIKAKALKHTSPSTPEEKK